MLNQKNAEVSSLNKDSLVCQAHFYVLINFFSVNITAQIMRKHVHCLYMYAETIANKNLINSDYKFC